MKYPLVDFSQSDDFCRCLRMCDNQFVGTGKDENWNRDDEEGIKRQRCLYVAMQQRVQRPLESASWTFDMQVCFEHTSGHEIRLARVKPIIDWYNHSQ